MPIRASARTALAAALSLLPVLAAPTCADSPLAASGPYTLTQSLVDADAAYLGWAAGRALTPTERRHLGGLDLARFRRDPAWTIKTLSGEQKNLPLFQTLDGRAQAGLRRTVLTDLPSFQASHLTPDEARQMQQITSGTDRTAAVPRPGPGAPTAAPPVVTASGARLPVHSGPYTLTQGMVNDDLAVWQLVAGRPLRAADRQTITGVDVDLFRRVPAWLVANIRQGHKNLPRLRRADPVVRAELRQANLVDIYCTPQKQHLTAEDAAQLQAVMSHYVPVVGVDATTGAVVTEADVNAWVAATRYFTAQAHVPGPTPAFRPALVQMTRRPSGLGPQAEAEAADMERNWAAFRLIWPHLSGAQRAQVMGRKLAKMKAAAARGQNLSLASAVALQASQNAFEQYPYALDPRLAAYKLRMDMRMGRFQQNMMNYNIQTMMRGQENYQRSLRGEGPNPAIIPLPVP